MKCKRCESEFEPNPNAVKGARDRQVFCSKECAKSWHWDKHKKHCPECGELRKLMVRTGICRKCNNAIYNNSEVFVTKKVLENQALFNRYWRVA